MTTTPHLARIQIFPVKSLDPVFLDQATFLPSGALKHDRQFALVDEKGVFINGKRTPQVHRLRSNFNFDERRVHLEIDGHRKSFQIDTDLSALEGWLSDFFSMPVSMIENLQNGFPDDLDAPGPTVISTGTLEIIASWFPGLNMEEVRRRFRANLEIDGVPPFWEDRLYRKKGEAVYFKVGQVPLAGTNPCQRCVVPTRDPVTGDVLSEFGKIFAKRRASHLPPRAERSRFDHFYRVALNTRLAGPVGGIKVGDQVQVVGQG